MLLRWLAKEEKGRRDHRRLLLRFVVDVLFWTVSSVAT